MIKVVSFDLGKTLIKPVIQNSGLCKYIADNLKVSYMIMKPFYRSHFLERRISLSEFCAALGEDNQEKVLCLIENYYSEKKYNGIYEDVLPTLSKLKAKGYRLVCISNKPYCNFTYLSTYNLGSFLRQRYTPVMLELLSQGLKFSKGTIITRNFFHRDYTCGRLIGRRCYRCSMCKLASSVPKSICSY